MRFMTFERADGCRGLAVHGAGQWRGLCDGDAGYPGDLDGLLATGADLAAVAERLSRGEVIDVATVRHLPPLGRPGKILCIGLNYVDHSNEAGFEPPSYPTVFARFASSLVGHGAPMIRPRQSQQLDYEGELVAVIGRGGRNIPRDLALNHVAGYSIFNDGSVRDYQFKSPQWTMGKNFDTTGAFGPCFVSADELPPGARGLRLQTRLNGRAVQDATTADMLFDVPTLVSLLSEVMTLSAGDIIVTGTPGGVGMARKPPLYMQPGDVCEVEIESIGVLRTPVVQGE
ncbi:fumarylacetoacetate hydrolase family protein [Uliginosibacterium sp. sgz301328]|uniref:fumarylacetoacetate hydrolase family protein n=1 Tax=Uliginosibacterium sp. sgz301328 TaxID=3243764 RepID=UPI00359EEAAA